MAIERVRDFLLKAGYLDRLQEFEVSSATVELAAQAVGVDGARIAKTLSFQDGEGCLLVVAAGDAKIDNARFKARYGRKARMLTAEQAERMTGHKVGGVCPFALPQGVPVYLDVSLQRFDTVYPAGGSASSAVRLTPAELEELCGAAGWVDVCRGWREDA